MDAVMSSINMESAHELRHLIARLDGEGKAAAKKDILRIFLSVRTDCSALVEMVSILESSAYHAEIAKYFTLAKGYNLNLERQKCANPDIKDGFR
jgi:hypothetical protein